MRKQHLVMAVSALGLMASVALSGASAQDKTIKIGALLPTSGPGAYFGAQDKQGIELALEQLNKTVSTATSLPSSTRIPRARRCPLRRRPSDCSINTSPT